MAALSNFLFNLYSTFTIFFTLLAIEVVILVKSIIGNKPELDKSVITTTQYFKLIEEKNPTRCLTKRLQEKLTKECSVCLSDFKEGEKIRNLQCNHTFHKDCLDNWLQLYKATCPLCRTKVLPDNVVDSYHRIRNQVQYDGGNEDYMALLSALHGSSLYRYI